MSNPIRTGDPVLDAKLLPIWNQLAEVATEHRVLYLLQLKFLERTEMPVLALSNMKDEGKRIICAETIDAMFTPAQSMRKPESV